MKTPISQAISFRNHQIRSLSGSVFHRNLNSWMSTQQGHHRCYSCLGRSRAEVAHREWHARITYKSQS